MNFFLTQISYTKGNVFTWHLVKNADRAASKMWTRICGATGKMCIDILMMWRDLNSMSWG